MTDFLIVTCRGHAKDDRNAFNKVLKRKEAVSELKVQFAKEKKMDVTKSQLIGASYSHQKYNSPQCAMAVAQAFQEFNNLQSASAKYKYVKDQILIWCVGLEWEEAYHPWWKNGFVYTPAELLKHLTMVVIPLQRHKTVPDHPPMNLPTFPTMTMPTLGTRAGI